MPRTALIAASALVAAGLGYGGYLIVAGPSAAASFAECGAGQSRVGAEIGGPFELTAGDGSRMTSERLIDRPTLIYFGYTFCPDFCPTDAAVMASAKDMLDERGVDARVAFVTVDPARDTPEVVGSFADNLHPEMVGLSGSESEIEAAARAYKVYFDRHDDTDDPFYLVDHSTFTYLMLPEYGFVDFFEHNTPPDAMAERVACYAEAAAG